jgi:hypothetical protein
MTATATTKLAVDGASDTFPLGFMDESGTGAGPFNTKHATVDAAGAIITPAKDATVAATNTAIAALAAAGAKDATLTAMQVALLSALGALSTEATLGDVLDAFAPLAANTTVVATNTLVGSQNDTAWPGTGNGTLISILKALWTKTPVLAAGEAHIGQIGGHATLASASFTRPSNATQYAVGDTVANTGTVAAMQFTVSRINDKSFIIRRAGIKKSGTTVTAAKFRLHLYSQNPTPSADNAAFSTAEKSYLGAMDITVDKAFTDASKGFGIPNVGSEISGVPDSGTQIIYGILEALDVYTPVSAEVFTVTLEVHQD